MTATPRAATPPAHVVVSSAYSTSRLHPAQPPHNSPKRSLGRPKHDGIRVIVQKEEKRIKLYSRLGDDLTPRFPQIVEELERVRSRSCIIDGEAVACGDDGIACFELIRRWDSDQSLRMRRQ